MDASGVALVVIGPGSVDHPYYARCVDTALVPLLPPRLQLRRLMDMMEISTDGYNTPT